MSEYDDVYYVRDALVMALGAILTMPDSDGRSTLTRKLEVAIPKMANLQPTKDEEG